MLLSLLATAAVASAAPAPEQIRAALEAQPSCQNFVRFDEQNVYLGFGPYRRAFEEPRSPIPGKVRVAPLDGGQAFEFATDDGAIDAQSDGSTLFVLTFSAIEEWNLATRQRAAKYETYLIPGPLKYKEHAQAMARAGDFLLIAHGRLGISAFSMSKRRIINQFRLIREQAPLESMATGIAVQDGRAYVTVDDFTQIHAKDGRHAYRGVVVLDVNSLARIPSQIPETDPGVDAVVADADGLILSYSGMPLWTYPLKTAGTSPSFAQIWRFPTDGHPVGKAAVDAKFYYTCFASPPSSGKGAMLKVPIAIDRAKMKPQSHGF